MAFGGNNNIYPADLHRIFASVAAARKQGATVVAYPLDSALLERSRVHLIHAAQKCDLSPRQNYNREAPRLVRQIGRYAHAKQYKQMRNVLRTLRSRVGRVHREITRKIEQVLMQ